MKNLNAAHIAYVRTILKEMNLSPSALAKKAGIASTTLTRALNDPDHKYALSTTTISKIQKATGVNPVPFMEADDLADLHVGFYRQPAPFEDGEIEHDPSEPDDRTEGDIDTIVIGEARAGNWVEQGFEAAGESGWIDLVYHPYAKSSFAVIIGDQSVNRLAKPGEILICIRPSKVHLHFYDGDYVVVQRKSEGGNLVELSVRQIKKTGDVWSLEFDSDNPAFSSSIKLDGYPKTDELRFIGFVKFVVREMEHKYENGAFLHN